MGVREEYRILVELESGIFSGMVRTAIYAFLQGFLRKAVLRCGVLVVKLWWKVWQPWTLDLSKSGDENYAQFSGLF
jgi:hypothetical protein